MVVRHHNSHKAHDDYWRSSKVLKLGYNLFISIKGDKSLMVEACLRNSLLLEIEVFYRSGVRTKMLK
jgi:hypothetical protein